MDAELSGESFLLFCCPDAGRLRIEISIGRRRTIAESKMVKSGL